MSLCSCGVVLWLQNLYILKIFSYEVPLSVPLSYSTGRKVYTAPPLRQDIATIASPHMPLSSPLTFLPLSAPLTAMAIGWSGITPRLRVAPVRAQ